MQLSGEELFSEPQEVIWAHVSDEEFLVKCLPRVESVSRDKAGRLECRVRTGVSFLSGTLKVTLDVSPVRPPSTAQIRVHSKGIGSSAIVEAQVELSPTNPGTRLQWTAEIVELGGLLKPVGRELISATAQKVIEDGWLGFRQALASRPDDGQSSLHEP